MPQSQGSWKFVNEGGNIKAVRDDTLHQEDGQDKSVGGVGEFSKSASAGLSLEAEKSGSAAVVDPSKAHFGKKEEDEEGTPEAQKTSAKATGGGGGNMTALGVSGKVSAGASAGTEGVSVEAAAGAELTLIGGKLYYYTKPKVFTFGGQQFRAQAGAELSAKVCAEAQGKVQIEAKQEGNGFKVDAGAGASAFAGAKGEFKLMGKLEWNDGSEFTDLIAAEVGLSGFAGVAAVAQVTASLVPCIEFSANIGVAAGFGGGISGSFKMNPIAAAKVTIALAAAGLRAVWDGVKTYGTQLGDWLQRKGKAFRQAAADTLGNAISGISGFFKGLWSWF